MTDTTPTTPLDLIEQGLREAAEDRRIAATMKQDRNRETLIRRAEVTESLVEEVKRLRHTHTDDCVSSDQHDRLMEEVEGFRASLHLSMSTLKNACDVLFEASGLDARYEGEVDLIHETVIGLRADRDAAIARTEAAEGEARALDVKLADEMARATSAVRARIACNKCGEIRSIAHFGDRHQVTLNEDCGFFVAAAIDTKVHETQCTCGHNKADHRDGHAICQERDRSAPCGCQRFEPSDSRVQA